MTLLAASSSGPCSPVAVLIQVTPIIAYAPAFVIWLGAGLKPILAITTLVCFVPFLFNAVTGLRSVDPATHELLRSRERQRPGDLLAPPPAPRPALPLRRGTHRRRPGADRRRARRVVRARVDEGLGVAIRKALNFNDVDQLWASILTLGFMGGVTLLLLSVAERVALHWHPSQVTL